MQARHDSNTSTPPRGGLDLGGRPGPEPVRGLSPALVRLMAVTGAVTVANLYYAQPLLHVIATGLHVSQPSASLLVTASQIGYAAGMLFIVPAGDIMRRRPLLTRLLALCAVAMAGCAVAPNLPVLAVAAALAGVTSVVVQMLVPYAATLASDNERGKVIGTLMGGLLVGILLSRTFASGVAQVGGWRAVYGIAAAVIAVNAIVLRRSLPDHGRQLNIGYARQMRGVLAVVRAEPVLRWRSLIAACGFGTFGCFWTTITFLLSGPQYGFSQLEIGLFALVGTAGAITAMTGGRLLDAKPRLRWRVTGAALAALVASYIPIGLGGAHLGALGLALLIVGVLVMDACVQGIHVTNQSVIYDLLPEARSRITTVYITTMFAGGALGSAAGAQAYAHWGWPGATIMAAAFPALGLLFWLASHRHEVKTGSRGLAGRYRTFTHHSAPWRPGMARLTPSRQRAAFTDERVIVAYPQYPAAPPPPPQPLFQGPPPVQVAVAGPLPQSRLAVFFRLFMVIPHLIVLWFLAIAALVVAFLGWWGALFMGRLPDFAASYLTGFIRWAARVEAYTFLLTGAYPPFTLDDVPDYPVRLATTRERLNRWAVFFRIILAIPAEIVGAVLVYGAFTIVLFISWLIALVTGRLPVSLHLAYATVFRYHVRSYCYFYLLTPAYPWWGLFGDGDLGPAPPGPGLPGGYGYTADPGGYGPGQGYGQPAETGYDTPSGPAYGPPGGPGYDPPGVPAYGGPGYGPPGGTEYSPPGGPGYGPPGGYGPPPGGYAQAGGYGPPPALDDPSGWRLLLTPAARQLVVLFIVLGALGYGAQTVVQQFAFGSKSNNTLSAVGAVRTLRAANTKLNTQIGQFQTATQACDGKLTCLERADAKAAGYFTSFGNTVRSMRVPSDAAAAAGKVYSDSVKVATDFTQLSRASSVGQYQTLANADVQQDSDQFDHDANALQDALNRDLGAS